MTTRAFRGLAAVTAAACMGGTVVLTGFAAGPAAAAPNPVGQPAVDTIHGQELPTPFDVAVPDTASFQDELAAARSAQADAAADEIAAEQEVLRKRAAERRAKERAAAARAAARSAERAAAKAASLRHLPVPPGSYHLTARFGEPGSWSAGYHTGLDFAAPPGTDVFAARAGKVISTGWAGAYGNRIEISHGNGVVTTYNHLSNINVSTGESVEAGQKIGDVGTTGRSTGPHLHFEVEVDGQFRNPAGWLGL